MGGLVADLVGGTGQPHLIHHAAGEGAAVHVAWPLGVPAHYAHLLPLVLGELAAGLCQAGVIPGEEGLGLSRGGRIGTGNPFCAKKMTK